MGGISGLAARRSPSIGRRQPQPHAKSVTVSTAFPSAGTLSTSTDAAGPSLRSPGGAPILFGASSSAPGRFLASPPLVSATRKRRHLPGLHFGQHAELDYVALHLPLELDPPALAGGGYAGRVGQQDVRLAVRGLHGGAVVLHAYGPGAPPYGHAGALDAPARHFVHVPSVMRPPLSITCRR